MTSDVGIPRQVLSAVVPQRTGGPATAPGGHQSAAKADPHRPREAEAAARDSDSVNTAVSELNQLVRDLHRELRFSVDEDSGDTVIKVLDSETEEVLRQIPSEEVMRLRQRLEEAAGVVFRDSA